MIRARNLRAPHGLHDASFALESGLVALVGPNGSGKTTLLRALAGLVRVEGELDVAEDFAYLPQKLEFLGAMPVRDVVALGRAPHLGRLGRLSEKDMAAVARAMEATATIAFAARPVGELSGGEQARVGLARALASQAPILLADEPTASLDASAALDMMARLKALPGLVVCAVHDLALAHHFAERVLVMSEGCLVADGGSEVLEGDIVESVFGVRPPRRGWQIAQAVAKSGV